MEMIPFGVGFYYDGLAVSTQWLAGSARQVCGDVVDFLHQIVQVGSDYAARNFANQDYTSKVLRSNHNIIKMATVTTIDLLTLATSLPYAANIASFNSPSGLENITFHSYNDSFSTILGPNPSSQLLANETWQAFHEAGVYHQDTKSLYIASNWAGSFENPINVSVLSLEDYSVSSVRYTGLASPNGGTTYLQPGGDGKLQLLFCDEGDFNVASGLTIIDPTAKTTKPVINSFYGHNFSSLNDVRQHYETGDLWFTDASYGFFQDFRPPNNIPNQVYRFEPLSGNIQAVADGFQQSNGLEFSPDFKTLYVTDTGAQLLKYGGLNYTRPATIYAFDVIDKQYLQNRRTFAYVDIGLPDGIHTDTEGNVYAGCGDGVQVWNPQGRLLGKIRVESGVANFAFVPGGIILFNEYRLFLARLAARGREIARDFGM